MIGWSISLGRIAGTELRIHITFMLLLLWLAVSAWLQGGNIAAEETIAFILAVFACILLHEGGHAAMARHYGLRTRDITLLPIGGLATMERLPEKPHQELLVALAGPAVNLLIGAVLFVSFDVSLTTDGASPTITYEKLDFVSRLAFVNVGLALFNMIPAFPMDGGRVLRALLSFSLGRTQATEVAAHIGQGIAFVLGFLGLFGNPILLLIAVFVFLAATHETFAVELSETTQGVPMAEATITQFDTLPTGSTVAQAAQKLMTSTQREFPVTDNVGQLRGVLTRDGIIKALMEGGPNTAVLDVIEPDITTVNRRAPLSEAVALLQSDGRPMVAVVDDNNRVVGIVTSENLAEYLMVNHARRGWPRSRSVLI